MRSTKCNNSTEESFSNSKTTFPVGFSILSFSGFYLPGFKGGGPIRSVANLLFKLGDEIDFYLVTSDRDLGDINPYPEIVCNKWNVTGKGKIFYASPGISSLYGLCRIISNFRGNAIYLNGFFSFRFSIFPIFFWKIFQPKKSIIVAPKGEFSTGALGIKSFKKTAFIEIVRKLDIYRDVIWVATSKHEAEDIYRVIGRQACIRLASNISCLPSEFEPIARQDSDPLRILFISRVSPMKNLWGAIQMLQTVKVQVVFDAYGPIEDADYWLNCQSAAKQLPANVQFRYCGPLFPLQIPTIMGNYDLFYLPTLGENYGHVIAEALGCGLPLLIADTTPWRNLERDKLGWDIPLDQPEQFVAAIESCSQIPAAAYQSWRRSIRSWALTHIDNDEAVEQNRQLFMNLEYKYEH